MMDKKSNVEFEMSPVRSLDDFLLESARFQIPNVKDLDKWGKRVYNNLLYYQTNYFLMSVLIFALVSLMHPTKMLCGTIAMLVAYGLFYFLSNASHRATQIKKDHPILGLLLIFGGGYFIVYMLGSVVIFIFGILLPISVTFVHASMRLRNIKNKLTNKIDTLTMRKTPMGMFLESLDSFNGFLEKEDGLTHKQTESLLNKFSNKIIR